ncbi:hypothetical protein E2986_06329 [Frieseomelitta varia]|uniref:Uncharacterized protein n=1 Tax=Frieseomelitta varia TaxID=561572 RepID=A0A833VME6_9HYME|nr:uncharacterized protein LOC122532965 [Frieseomelitta varia]XP_043518127.1 uncharacterized protein LOC122532965 [Frieseomelitta varia]XP_043518128.1 uncharacterized protein LOC122532965 [Frieseomelitta varia]XP_043518129.1 uncharacterized protein LOC122532965 [Frieseomelitta varia]XP_043518130.1 uncharacterized protein LOC122532965 [Frieseomelitta varia]XP_043518131.1 uncharacterized protein LOC122532965 [Frieseomelitta varia]XP_043518132.1 uncharacterized protein LOC122532965 [Frieseomelit
MTVALPYLDAVQVIPGDTPGEKFRFLANYIKQKLSVSDDLEKLIDYDKIPTILVPLVHIQTAIILNKEDPQNWDACLAIVEALKSEDKMIVNKALHASHFFDGTNKFIINDQFFNKNIFPYVSLNTRRRIIKILAFQLSSKKKFDLAEKFFLGVESLYGIEQALPLLVACSEAFTYNTIVEKRIVLSRQLVKRIFYRNPDLIVRYFKLSKPNLDPLSRNLHPVSIYDFNDILAQLVRKRLNSFVELCEIHEKVPPTVTLNNKTAELFLKNGKKHLYEKPQLYIKMIPLKKISNECMETIYPKLFPENIRNFDTDDMLKYLYYYPRDKKTDLFLKSYQQVYGRNILDEPKKITVELLKILSIEERTKQAKIKLEKDSGYTESSSSEMCPVNCVNFWDCYLPVDTVLPQFKKEISEESEMKLRTIIACKMIYCCYVNNNNVALLEVLTYLRNRHSNEQAWFISQMFQTLLTFYDLSSMGNEHWLILRKIISNAHMRKTLTADVQISVSMIEAAIHHNILQNKSIDILIDILVDLKCLRKTGYWNILQKYPRYEKMCLESCINVVSQKYHSNQTSWMEDSVGILYDLCISIYQFNHVHKRSRITPMTIADYPWLLTMVENNLSVETLDKSYIYQNIQNLLMKNDSTLYERFWPDDKKVKILTGEVLKILKRNPREILTKWRDYLNACQNYWDKYHTRVFIRSLRWYSDIPIKFALYCVQDLFQSNGMRSLNVLATLTHGETFSNIIEPLIPMDIVHQEVAVNYRVVQHIANSIRFTNPPVSQTILSKLCNLDPLLVFPVITNVCKRINEKDVISFAEILCTQKVSVQKHGIRLTNLVASRVYTLNFLCTQWNSKMHQSIRKILLSIIRKLFATEPGPITWCLFFDAISTLTIEYNKVLLKLIPMIASTTDEYVVDYVQQLVDIINKFEKAGLGSEQIAEYVSDLLSHINAAICFLLPDDFVKDLLRKYLFHQNLKISKASSMFIITSLLLPSSQGKFDHRMELFCNVFRQVIRSGWNVSHPKYPRFYPVNNGLPKFIKAVLSIFPFMKVDQRIIDKLLATFVSVLEPHMEPTSYLLLVYCNEKMCSTTPREFGLKLGKKMSDLIDIFSPFFMFFMADVLLQMPLLNLFDGYDKDEIDFETIEGLLEVGTISAALLATKLFKSVNSKEHPERYDKLIKKFLEYDSLAVKSSICDIINNSRDID